MTHGITLRALVPIALSALSASSAVAQAGVLIGVSTPVGYETLWIMRDSSRPVRATVPDLLVPRTDGWWRVGTVPICSTSGSEVRSTDVLWRARADSTPVISEICHELPRGELPLPIHAEDSATKDSLSRELVRCSWSTIGVKFVSPEHIAIGETSGQTGECEPRGGRWYKSYYVSRFNGDSSFALDEFGVSRADSLGRLALLRAAKELRSDEVCTTLVESFDANDVSEMGAQWYPTHVNGRWVPVLFHQIAIGDCHLFPIVDIGLTAALTGHDSLRVPWNVLTKRVKGLQDAFASPHGDLVIVRASDSLVVHMGAAEHLGRRIGAIPFREREIVMIQWATGRHAARWNHEIMAMLRRGLPEPRIMPAPKAP